MEWKYGWNDRLRRAFFGRGLAAVLMVTASASTLAAADQPAISIAINQSPWLNAFIAVVDKYEAETGNKIELDVTPFGGLLEKIRNSVRTEKGEYDIVSINSVWLAEIFAGGFFTPLKVLNTEFSLPPELLDYDSTAYWNADTKSFGADGNLMGVPLNGNVQVLYYRKDLYDAAGLTPPKTWEDLIANAKALNKQPDMYGFVPRAARNSIVYNFTPYLFSHGGSFLADPAKGDYSVAINSAEGLSALETYLQLSGEVAPPIPVRSDRAS